MLRHMIKHDGGGRWNTLGGQFGDPLSPEKEPPADALLLVERSREDSSDDPERFVCVLGEEPPEQPGWEYTYLYYDLFELLDFAEDQCKRANRLADTRIEIHAVKIAAKRQISLNQAWQRAKQKLLLHGGLSAADLERA